MNWIASLLPAAAHANLFGCVVVLLVSFLESLAFVGLLVPGTVFLVFAGSLSAQTPADFSVLLGFAAAGAVLGDGLSFVLGRRGVAFFRAGGRFFNPELLAAGERVFRRHGDASVFVGRFIGPVRPIIPFVAGVFRMDVRKFYVWNVLSAFAWAGCYLLLGSFLGQSWRLVAAWSTRAGLLVAALVVLLVCARLLKGLLTKRGPQLLDLTRSLALSIGQAVAQNPDFRRLVGAHPRLFAFLRERFDRREFSGLPLALFALVFGYTLLLLLGVVEDLLVLDPLVAADTRLANLLHAFRTPELVRVFLWVTFLGKTTTVILFACLFSAGLLLWRKRGFLLPLWIAVGGSGLMMGLGKVAFHRARPAGIAAYAERSFSFPSGHATASVAFYGFAAYFAWRHLTSWKAKLNAPFVAGFVILAVGFSRLYLGVHYLSDVLGGYLLGALWLIIGACLGEWGERRKLLAAGPQPSRLAVSLGTVFLVLLGLGYYGYAGSRYRPSASPLSPVRVVPLDRQGPAATLLRLGLPTRTETILGDRQEPLSLFMLARDDQSLTRAFERAGWRPSDPPGAGSLVRLASALLRDMPYPEAPMTPSFWNTLPNDFGFEKPTAANRPSQRYYARFWRTELRSPEGQTLYVGTASFDEALKWGVTHRISPAIDQTREALVADLRAAGVAGTPRRLPLVAPELGVNFLGDPFFTDGQALEVMLGVGQGLP